MPAAFAAATAFGPAGRPDEVDARVVEEVLRDVERRVGDHLQRVAAAGPPPRRPPAGSRRPARAQRAARADGRKIIALRVFARDDRLEQRGRGRVGDRQQRQHHADRLGDVLDAALGVLVDHADRLLVLQVVVEELGGDVVLDHLVLEHAEVGLLHRQLGELDGVLEPGDDHRPDDPVDRLLVELAQRRRGLARALDEAVQPCGPLDVRRGGRIFDCRGHGVPPSYSCGGIIGPSPAGSRIPSSSQL